MHRVGFLQLHSNYDSYPQRTKISAVLNCVFIQDSLHNTYENLWKVQAKSCLKDWLSLSELVLLRTQWSQKNIHFRSECVLLSDLFFWVRKTDLAFAKPFNFIWEATFKTHHLATCSAVPLALFPHPLLVAWCVLYPLGQLISWMHGCSRLSSEPANKSYRTTPGPIRDIFVLWFVFCRKHSLPLKAYRFFLRKRKKKKKKLQFSYSAK